MFIQYVLHKELKHWHRRWLVDDHILFFHTVGAFFHCLLYLFDTVMMHCLFIGQYFFFVFTHMIYLTHNGTPHLATGCTCTALLGLFKQNAL